MNSEASPGGTGPLPPWPRTETGDGGGGPDPRAGTPVVSGAGPVAAAEGAATPASTGAEVALLPGVVAGPQTLRIFRAVLVNTLVANVTTSYLWFALTFWAYLQTRSVLVTSVVGGSFMLFIALFGTFFGGVVDRYRKWVAMLASSAFTLVAFAAAGVIFVLGGGDTMARLDDPVFWVFTVVVLAGAVVESLRNIATSTTVTLLVPAAQRDKANGAVGTVQGIAFMITSVFSGLSVGLLGMGWTLVIACALTALTVAHLLVLRIPERRPPRTDPTEREHSVAVAWRSIRQVPGLLALVAFTTFNNLVGGVYMALMDPYGLTLFRVETWGIVLGVTSVGFIIGGAAVARFGLGPSPLRTLLLVNVAVALIGGLFAIREWPWLFAVGIGLYMCFIPAAEAAEQTILQRVVRFEIQGRVFGFAQAVEVAASPISAYLIGPVAQFVLIPYMASDAGRATWGWLLGAGQARGIALVFLLASVVMLLVVLVAFASRPYRLLSRAYREAAPQPVS